MIKILIFLLFLLIYLNSNFLEKYDNIKWTNVEKANKCNKIFIKGNKIYKKCVPTENYLKIQGKNFPFIPRAIYDRKNDITIEDYYQDNLTKFNKPSNYIDQINNIQSTLNDYNICHNDIKMRHFFVENGEIKLIDWDKSRFEKKCDVDQNNYNKIKKKLRMD